MFAHILFVEVTFQLFLLPIWPLVSFLKYYQWQIYTVNKPKIFWIILSRWEHCMYEGTTRFGELLTKVFFFQGTQKLMAKLPKVQKMISEIWQTLSLCVSTEWTTASFCLLPYFEAKWSRVCPHHALEKRAKTKTSARPGLPLSQIKTLYTSLKLPVTSALFYFWSLNIRPGGKFKFSKPTTHKDLMILDNKDTQCS